MTTVVGIAGSLRTGSYNRALLRAAAGLAPAGLTVHIASIRGIPLYDGDMERDEGIPSAVAELQDLLAGADGILLVTPEYNHGIPGVFKNAIDWLSRPPTQIERVFHNKAVATMGVTPGKGGTRFSQLAWLPVLRALGTRPYEDGEIYLADATKLFDADLRLTDEDARERIEKYMVGFAAFVADNAPS